MILFPYTSNGGMKQAARSLRCYVMNLVMCTGHPLLLGLKFKRTRWAGHVAKMVETRNIYKIFNTTNTKARHRTKY
jgi:hypothetical protein